MMGKSARQGGIIDTETNPYDMLIIDMAGIQDGLHGGSASRTPSEVARRFR